MTPTRLLSFATKYRAGMNRMPFGMIVRIASLTIETEASE
jgi:hypothetical protein